MRHEEDELFFGGEGDLDAIALPEGYPGVVRILFDASEVDSAGGWAYAGA